MIEECPRGEADGAGGDAFGLKQLLCLDAEPDLGAGADEDDLWTGLVLEDVCALAHAAVDVDFGSVDDVQILTAEGHEGRLVALESETPCGGGLIRVGGAVVGEMRDGAEHGELLDGLVRGSIFAEADGIMREDEERVRLHQGGHADGRLGVIREGEEGGTEGNKAAMFGHAVDRGTHGELADAEEDVAACGIDVEVCAGLKDGFGRGGEVSCAAEELR